MARIIHLVRHGEPEAGYTKRYLGRLDPSLSPRGMEQARAVSRRLRALEPRRLFCSGLKRARETADIIGDAVGLTPEEDPRLLEVSFGKLEGLTFKEASARFPGIVDSWQALSGDFSFPGGESYADFNRRAADMAAFARSCPEERILLVAHGGLLRAVLCNLLDIPADGPLRFRLAYATVTTVEALGASCVLTGFNQGRTDPPSRPA